MLNRVPQNIFTILYPLHDEQSFLLVPAHGRGDLGMTHAPSPTSQAKSAWQPAGLGARKLSWPQRCYFGFNIKQGAEGRALKFPKASYQRDVSRSRSCAHVQTRLPHRTAAVQGPGERPDSAEQTTKTEGNIKALLCFCTEETHFSSK